VTCPARPSCASRACRSRHPRPGSGRVPS
jgi:hypothetical protein